MTTAKPGRRVDRIDTIGLRHPLVSVGLLAGWLAAYMWLLRFAYQQLIAPDFGYMGLSYRSPDDGTYALVCATVLLVGLLLPRQLSKPSEYSLWVIFLIATAPTMLVSQYAPILTPSESFTLALVAGGSTLAIRAVTAIPIDVVRPSARNGSGWLWTALLFSLFVYAVLILVVGVNLTYLRFSDVYDVRRDFATDVKAFPGFGYLWPVQANVINPLLIARGISYRERSLLCIGVPGQLLIYATTGNKSVLLSMAAIVGVALILRGRQTLTASQVVGPLVLLMGAAILAHVLWGKTFFTSLLIRRLIVLPGLLSAIYVAVFQQAEMTRFLELIPQAEVPGGLAPSQVVGLRFFGSPDTSANASFLAHGYASWGYSGVLLEAAAVAGMLVLADNAARGLPAQLGWAIFFVPAFLLASSSAFTTLFTHGFLAAVLIAMLLPRSDGETVHA